MASTKEMWSYERKRRCDKTGMRWHFVSRSILDPGVPYQNRPFELYFRDDDRTEFGLIRFSQRKNNPYRNYEALAVKIVNDPKFRRSLLDPRTKAIWKRSWK